MFTKPSHTKITLTDFHKDTPAFYSGLQRIGISYQIARRLADAVFAKHKCATYEVTEAGIVGIRPDGTTVLLERNDVEQYVLSCFTDLAMRDLPSELSMLVREHNNRLYNESRQKEADRIAAEEAEREQKEDEASREMWRLRELVSDITEQIQNARFNLEDAERSLKNHKGYVPPEGALESHEDHKAITASITARVEELRTQYDRQQKELAEAQKQFKAAVKKYSQITGKPVFDD